MIFYSCNSVFWLLIILFIFFNNRFSNSKKRRPFLILQTKQSPLRSSFQVKKNHTKPTKPSVFSLSHPPPKQNKQVVLWTAKLITSGVRKISAYPSTLASPSGFSLYVLMSCADAPPPHTLFFPLAPSCHPTNAPVASHIPSLSISCPLLLCPLCALAGSGSSTKCSWAAYFSCSSLVGQMQGV